MVRCGDELETPDGILRELVSESPRAPDNNYPRRHRNPWIGVSAPIVAFQRMRPLVGRTRNAISAFHRQHPPKTIPVISITTDDIGSLGLVTQCSSPFPSKSKVARGTQLRHPLANNPQTRRHLRVSWSMTPEPLCSGFEPRVRPHLKLDVSGGACRPRTPANAVSPMPFNLIHHLRLHRNPRRESPRSGFPH